VHLTAIRALSVGHIYKRDVSKAFVARNFASSVTKLLSSNRNAFNCLICLWALKVVWTVTIYKKHFKDKQLKTVAHFLGVGPSTGVKLYPELEQFRPS